jgi:membrane protein DedA with SNARE-associated domain
MFDAFKDWISGVWVRGLVIFAVSAIDAFFPLVPSESIVITAGNLASSGDLWLLGVILSASAGAIVGDNISYLIGKWAGEHTVKRLFRSEKARHGFEWAEHQLETRGFYIIVIARFIPGGRTAVTFASGYTHGMTWRRFIVADVCAGLLWGTYAAMLGYVGGKTFEDAPWKGLLLGFAIALTVAMGIEAVRWYLHRRRRAGAVETAADADSS